MALTTPVRAVRHPRFLLTSWPWRSLGYALATTVVAAVVWVPLFLLGFPLLVLLILAVESAAGQITLSVWTVTLLLLVGALTMGLGGPLVALPVAALERRRLRLIHPPVTGGHRAPPPGLWQWLRTRYTEPATWRELAYLLLLGLVLAPLSAMVLYTLVGGGSMMAVSPLVVALDSEPLALGTTQIHEPMSAVPYGLAGIVVLVFAPYPVALVVGAHGFLTRILLRGRDQDELRAELVEITRSRARLVDAFEAERRRIERDLHDGAQQRLVALAMQLGLARLDTPAGSPVAKTITEAHEQAKRLIVELRELIHGIHPQILTDRGLQAALPELADRCPVPVEVRMAIDHRLPGHVEGTAYFVVAEALTNVAKHSEATRVTVRAEVEAGVLVVEVTDNGRGGAEASDGTGLTGLGDRVAVMDGRMLLSSPPGGPTRLRVELPCGQSQPSSV